MPSVREVMRDARKDAEDSEEPRYEGAYVAKEVGLVDTRPIIDKKCRANPNPNPNPNRNAQVGQGLAKWRATARVLSIQRSKAAN